MVVWMSLIGGIIIGWLIEWVIDWYYWRRGAEAFYATEQDLRQELAATRRALEEAQATIVELREETPEGAPRGKASGARGESRSSLPGNGGQQSAR